MSENYVRAGAVEGAISGAIAGDAAGQVVTSMRQGNCINAAVKNVSREAFSSKAIEGAVAGAIGAALGGAVGKGLKVAETASKVAIKTARAENIEGTVKTIRQIGASTRESQGVVNANDDVATEAMKKGWTNANKATNSTITKVSAGTAMATESTSSTTGRIEVKCIDEY